MASSTPRARNAPLGQRAKAAWAIAVGLVLAGLLVVGLPASATPSAAGVVHSSAYEGTTPPAEGPEYLGEVAATLDLFNSTVHSGYSLSLSTSFPMQVVLDTENGTAWVGGGNVGTTGIDVVNPANETGVRILPGGLSSGVAYDNRTNTMWITGGGSTNSVTVYNASTYALVGTVGTGIRPSYAVYDYETDSMFVANFGSANVTEIGASNLTSWASIPVGAEPGEIGYDSVNGELYVANEDGVNVSAFGQMPGSAHVSIELPGAGQMSWLFVDTTNGEVYVDGYTPGLAIINTTSESMVGTIALPGSAPYAYDGLAFDPVNESLFVGSFSHDEVVEFAPAPTATTTTNQGVTIFPTDSQPLGMAYDLSLGRALVVDQDQDDQTSVNLTEIAANNNTLVGGTALYDLPDGIAYASAHGTIYVYDGQSGDLDFVNESTLAVERSVFVGYTGPQLQGTVGFVAYDAANDTVYVDFQPSYSIAGGVAVVNASTDAVTYLPAQYFSEPSGIAYDPSDHRVFVANDGSGRLAELTPGASGPPTNITVEDNPRAVVFDGANDGVYVANGGSDSVSVVHGSTATVVATPAVGSGPAGLAYDPANGDIYAANSGVYTLSVISGLTNTTGGTIEVGGTDHPTFLAYDPINETILASEPEPYPGFPGTELAFVNATNSTLIGSLSFGGSLGPVVWDPDTNAALVAGTYPGSLYELTTGAVPPPPPSLSATLTAVPPSVEVNGATSLETEVTGATAALTYAYSTLPPGCVSSSVATLVCTPTATGTYYVGVNVTQSGGGQASAVAMLEVTPRAGALGVTLSASPATFPKGTLTTLTATVTGGASPFGFVYSGLPSGCTTENVSSFACAPSRGGSFTIQVNVTDADAATASATTIVRVGSLHGNLTATPSIFNLGNTTNLTAVPMGHPLGPLTYLFTELPPGCSSANSTSILCAPIAPGLYTPQVEVHDTLGDFMNASVAITVNATPVPLAASLIATPGTVTLGGSTTLTAIVSGGAAPYDYSFSRLPPGCASANTRDLVCTPSAFGTFVVGVTVTDSVGHIAAATSVIHVVGNLTAILAIGPPVISLGAAVTLTVTVGGQHTSALSYVYSGLPTGCTSTNASHVTCTPSASGAFDISVEVHDSAGHFANATATLGVSPVVSLPVTTAAFPWIWVAAGAGLAIVGIALLFYRVRRRPPMTKSTGPSAATPTESPSGGPPTP
jgi:YVTN family beta-propeller protein